MRPFSSSKEFALLRHQLGDGARAGTGDSKAGTVVVPLYLSDTREALLTELQLPCVEGAARWILAGLAAVCGAAQ